MSKLNKDDALYRVRLKRIVRMAVGFCDNATPTRILEKSVGKIAKNSPNVVAKSLDAAFESAAQAWTRGNNSGNQAGMDAGDAECHRQRYSCERVLGLFKIQVDYPGLYPSFTVNAFEHHSTLSALNAAIARSAVQ